MLSRTDYDILEHACSYLRIFDDNNISSEEFVNRIKYAQKKLPPHLDPNLLLEVLQCFKGRAYYAIKDLKFPSLDYLIWYTGECFVDSKIFGYFAFHLEKCQIEGNENFSKFYCRLDDLLQKAKSTYTNYKRDPHVVGIILCQLNIFARDMYIKQLPSFLYDYVLNVHKPESLRDAYESVKYFSIDNFSNRLQKCHMLDGQDTVKFRHTLENIIDDAAYIHSRYVSRDTAFVIKHLDSLACNIYVRELPNDIYYDVLRSEPKTLLQAYELAHHFLFSTCTSYKHFCPYYKSVPRSKYDCNIPTSYFQNSKSFFQTDKDLYKNLKENSVTSLIKQSSFKHKKFVDNFSSEDGFSSEDDFSSEYDFSSEDDCSYVVETQRSKLRKKEKSLSEKETLPNYTHIYKKERPKPCKSDQNLTLSVFDIFPFDGSIFAQCRRGKSTSKSIKQKSTYQFDKTSESNSDSIYHDSLLSYTNLLIKANYSESNYVYENQNFNCTQSDSTPVDKLSLNRESECSNFYRLHELHFQNGNQKHKKSRNSKPSIFSTIIGRGSRIHKKLPRLRILQEPSKKLKFAHALPCQSKVNKLHDFRYNQPILQKDAVLSNHSLSVQPKLPFKCTNLNNINFKLYKINNISNRNLRYSVNFSYIKNFYSFHESRKPHPLAEPLIITKPTLNVNRTPSLKAKRSTSDLRIGNFPFDLKCKLPEKFSSTVVQKNCIKKIIPISKYQNELLSADITPDSRPTLLVRNHASPTFFETFVQKHPLSRTPLSYEIALHESKNLAFYTVKPKTYIKMETPSISILWNENLSSLSKNRSTADLRIAIKAFSPFQYDQIKTESTILNLENYKDYTLNLFYNTPS